MSKERPTAIEVRGAKKNNLKNIDVDIPLGKIVGVAGVSGSGKSSLALGIVYAEGSRRYLESLSTYTRRRMTQAERAEVDDVRYVPAALALRQRPGVPGIRSTFGTSTELLNSLRLMYSRLASHRCPNGHYLAPSLDVAAERELVCPECGARFFAPGAEELAFNSQGACKRCDGTGVVREVDMDTIIPDDSLTIDEGAVAPWQSLMWSLMKDIARDHLGVRTDVPWRDLTDRERDIVLHAPSIGLHPSNLEGLTGVMDDLVADGNSVLLVDHDTQVLAHADWIVELGPGAGAKGGRLVAEGTVKEIAKNPKSQIGPFLATKHAKSAKDGRDKKDARDKLRASAPPREIKLSTSAIHTVQPLEVSFPKGKLSVVTGVSGSGKTTLILESLVPGLAAQIGKHALPAHVRALSAPGIAQVKLIDATPIGINIRSTVATYANVHDELRKIYARTADAKERGYKAGDFSYNTGALRCPTCDGTGEINLDVQFLPDVDIPCPDCRGARYAKAAFAVKRKGVSLPELMAMSVDEALVACADLPIVKSRLQTLHDIGLGYLTLGEETPGLSGGEAQRLKLASEMGRGQGDTVFVFDEPTIGLHPLDVRTLMDVFRHLIGNGATVIVIEHDLDVIRAADWIVDMGPGGGKDGGRIVATGTPAEIKFCPQSMTGRYL